MGFWPSVALLELVSKPYSLPTEAAFAQAGIADRFSNNSLQIFW